MVAIEVIEDAERLGEVESAWREFEQTGGVAVPGSFDFVRSWLETRLRDRLQLVVLRREGQVVGLAPLKRVVRRLGPLRVPTVNYVTRNGFTPGVRALFRPGHEREAARALARYLGERRRPWGLVQLNNLEEGCPLQDALRERSRVIGRRLRLSKSEESVALAIPSSPDELRRRWNANRRRTMGPRLERLRGSHELSVEEIARPEQVDEGLAAAFHVAERSWQGENTTSIASTADSRAFYAALSSAFATKGGLSLWIVRLDGQPVAFHYALVFGETLYSLKWGYDSAYRREGVGIVSIGASLEAMCARGVTSAELFHPQTHAKSAWGAKARPLQQGRMPTASALGGLLELASRFSPLRRAARRPARSEERGLASA